MYGPAASDCADQLCRVSLNPCDYHYHQQSRQHPPSPSSTGLPGFACCCRFRSQLGSNPQTSWFLLLSSQFDDTYRKLTFVNDLGACAYMQLYSYADMHKCQHDVYCIGWKQNSESPPGRHPERNQDCFLFLSLQGKGSYWRTKPGQLVKLQAWILQFGSREHGRRTNKSQQKWMSNCHCDVLVRWPLFNNWHSHRSEAQKRQRRADGCWNQNVTSMHNFPYLQGSHG